MSTFYSSKINTSIKRVTNLNTMQTVAYGTQITDFDNKKDRSIINTDNSKKNRLSQFGRSTYGPQKLTRKK